MHMDLEDKIQQTELYQYINQKDYLKLLTENWKILKIKKNF